MIFKLRRRVFIGSIKAYLAAGRQRSRQACATGSQNSERYRSLRQHYRHWLVVGLDRQADRQTLIEDIEHHRKTNEYSPFDLIARLQFGFRSERRLSAGFQRGKSLVVAFEIHRRKGIAAQFAAG